MALKVEKVMCDFVNLGLVVQKGIKEHQLRFEFCWTQTPLPSCNLNLTKNKGLLENLRTKILRKSYWFFNLISVLLILD